MKLFYSKAVTLLFMATCALTTGCKKEVSYIHPTETTNTTTPVLVPTTNNNSNSIDALFSSLPVDSASKTTFFYNQKDNPQFTKHDYQGCPSIGQIGGYYFCAFQTGGKGEQPGNYISVATSQDGVIWKQHQLIVSSFDPTVRHFDALFWDEADGTLRLSWASTKGMWDGGALGTWCVKIRVVNDVIQVTKPKFLFNGVTNTKPIYTGFDNKTILFPVSGFIVPNPWNTYPITPTPLDRQGAFFSTSKQNGHDFSAPDYSSKINTTGLWVNFAEVMTVETERDQIQALIRTDKGAYKSNSTDGGKTWSTPAVFTEVGATASSRAYFKKLSSGNILLILNNSAHPVRSNMTAFLSKDGGKTYPYKMVIDTRTAIAYPDAIEEPSGVISLVYDRERATEQEINFVKFTEDDIVRGKLNTSVIVVTHK